MVNSTLDPKKLYESYISNPKNRGLGSIFQEEGAGLGPSTSLIKEIEALRLMRKGQIAGGMDPRIVNPQIDRRTLESMKSDEMSKILAPEDVGSALEDYQAAQRRYGIDSFLPPPSPNTLGEKKVRKEKRASEANRIANLIEENPSIAADSPLDEIANLIKKSEIPSPDYATMPMGEAGRTKTQEERTAEAVAKRKQETEEFRAKEAKIADAQGMPSGEITEESPKDPKEKGAALQNLVDGSVEEYMKILGKDVPDAVNREEALKKYKKEFSEATGIDVTGKVDKSSALMAFGLAMMQNRAGKGFNVGRILSETGKAGEAAMPALEKAKDEAKQGRIAAGKYALQQIKSDEDARDAIIASNAALKKELLLKDLEFKRDRQLLIDEAILEGNEVKLTEALKNTEQKTIEVGAKKVNIGMGQDLEFGGRSVFSSPEFDARIVADSYKKTGEGINILRQMEDLLFQLKDQGEGNIGGTALQGILGSVISVGNSMGMNIEYPSGDDVALTQQLEVLQRQVLTRFKKFIAQETGNGISNVDVKDIKAALGQFETFQDIDKAIMSVGEMQQLFSTSQGALDEIVDMFMDRNSYRGNEQGTADYDKVVKLFSEKFGNISVFKPTIVEGPNGQTIIDYDIRTGV